MVEKAVVYALTANVDLVQDVCNQLGLHPGKCEVKHFSDGEIIVENLQSVRGKNVYVIQSTCNPVTERLMELLVFVDGLRRASAKEVNVIMPYYGYSRQDRKAKPREPITARLVADLLEAVGIHRVVVFDLHAPQIQGFYTCPVDNLSAIPMFGRYFRSKIKNSKEKAEYVVVSPDHGGATRARKLATLLGCSIAIIDKRRPRPNVAEVMNIIGDVEGKVAIMIDDMIDTAGTITAGAKALKKAGAIKVYAACTHGIFSGEGRTRINESEFEEVVITDTIPLKNPETSPKIKVLSVATIIAKVIERIEDGVGLSEVYDEYNQE